MQKQKQRCHNKRKKTKKMGAALCYLVFQNTVAEMEREA